MHSNRVWFIRIVIISWIKFVSTETIPCDSRRCLQQEIFYCDYLIGIILRNGASLSSCELIQFRDEAVGQKVLLELPHLPKRKVSFSEAFEIMNECHNLDFDISQKEPDFMDLNMSTKVWSSTLATTILPGTKWCGRNDIAKNYHDLGQFEHLDACCRQHDLCPVKIFGHEVSKKYKLANNFFFTTVHCRCDLRFLSCLRSIETYISLAVKMLFNQFLHPKCLETCTGNNCTSQYYYKDGPQRRK